MLETKMRRKLITLLPETQIQPIETTTNLGVPDLSYTFELIQGWIELKQVARIGLKTLQIPWRPGQYAWYLRYSQKSKQPYILCLTIQNRWYFFKNEDVKLKYDISTLEKGYICETKELIKSLIRIKEIIHNL